MFDKEKVNYLLVGGFNTIVGYTIGVSLYKILSNNLSIISIGVISNIFSITISFLSYKIFVFRTKGMWLSEYSKAYIIYSGTSLVGIFLLWFFVDKMKISIWVSQALIIMCTVIISYIGHSRFTFRHRPDY